MFIKENGYVQNKGISDAIVYTTANGSIFLTKDDFENEEEFLRWKAWSDQNYQEEAHHDRPFFDHVILTDDYESIAALMETTCEAESSDLSHSTSYRRQFQAAYPYIKRSLTKKQLRRFELFLYGVPVSEIAKAEGVPHQDISKSIAAAKRKLIKIMKRLSTFY